MISMSEEVTTKVYPHQIAFNCLPHIDVFQENGYTKEEMKMVNETRKILEDDSIMVSATTVRVPVFLRALRGCLDRDGKKNLSRRGQGPSEPGARGQSNGRSGQKPISLGHKRRWRRRHLRRPHPRRYFLPQRTCHVGGFRTISEKARPSTRCK